MLVVDDYLDKRYITRSYDCLSMAQEAWHDATGEDVGERLASLLGRGMGRRVSRTHRLAFRRLAAPEDPCLVLMRRARSAPHVGVYVRGRVLHLTERGAEFTAPSVAGRGFSRMEFYR